MQVVVMATQGFSSAAEATSSHVKRTGSVLPHFPWSKVTLQVTDMLPAATWNRHMRQIIDFPAARAFAVTPLFYGFLSPDNVQQK